MKKKRSWAVVILSLAGAVFSGILTHQFYQVRNGDAGFHSFCNIGQSMNCDVVAASRYAELIPGLPLSTIAAGWFLALIIIGLFSLSQEWRKDGIKIAFVMACLGGAASLGYFAIMALVQIYCRTTGYGIFAATRAAVPSSIFGCS